MQARHYSLETWITPESKGLGLTRSNLKKDLVDLGHSTDTGLFKYRVKYGHSKNHPRYCFQK